MVENMPGVIDMFVPVVPVTPKEAKLSTRDPHVGSGPVARVGTDRSPLVVFKNLTQH